MALVLMSDEELNALGINGQGTGFLDTESGVFIQDGWDYLGTVISNDGTEFVRDYFNGITNIYIRTKNTIDGSGGIFPIYAIYKDV